MSEAFRASLAQNEDGMSAFAFCGKDVALLQIICGAQAGRRGSAVGEGDPAISSVSFLPPIHMKSRPEFSGRGHRRHPRKGSIIGAASFWTAVPALSRGLWKDATLTWTGTISTIS